jgi:hypothetical protein
VTAGVPQVAAVPAPKILEIGGVPYMWKAFPQATEFYSTWPDETESAPQHGRHIVTFAGLPRLARRLADPSFDLIVVHAPAFRPWSSRALVRSVFRRGILKGRLPLSRGFAAELLRVPPAAPLAVIDLEDATTIARGNAFLLDRCSLYFKRELPTDHWGVFAGTMHWRVPTPRFRAAPRNRARIAKLRPISLGVPFGLPERLAASPPPDRDKTIDVFFAGRIRNSATVRERGFEELISLRNDGYAIDVCEQEISIDEYLARCARAHLVWSPEGYGWQCFRTYEAAICGTAPLCSRQSIERYRPLMEGVHAVYYDVEPGELTRVIRTALADRERLRAMGDAARRHVLAFHTPAVISRHMVEATLAAAGRSSAPRPAPANSHG